MGRIGERADQHGLLRFCLLFAEARADPANMAQRSLGAPDFP